MLSRKIFEQTLRQHLAPIESFLSDPTVSEVLINGPDAIYIEREGRLFRTDARFPSSRALMAALRNIGQFVGRSVDEDNPILEARLPDGSRVQAVLPPIASDGPNVSIRRFYTESMTMARLLGSGSISQDAAEFLDLAVKVKQNIIVSGGTGSGKTSLLNVLTDSFFDDERLVVIEDSREVQIRKPHVVHLEARHADAEGQGSISIRDLFRTTLRMRPDRIIIGEVRGGEALDLIQAMTSGHSGSLATVHATHVKDALSRLETLALMSDVELPLLALRLQIASAVDLIVQTERLRDGSRHISQIAEVHDYDTGKGYQLVVIFERHYGAKEKNGRVPSELKFTGVRPRVADLAAKHGF
ncbi:MAG: CpaF family protein [Myxococcales bacterium]|nr:CpaF family protein [Myxococcales bacterium]